MPSIALAYNISIVLERTSSKFSRHKRTLRVLR